MLKLPQLFNVQDTIALCFDCQKPSALNFMLLYPYTTCKLFKIIKLILQPLFIHMTNHFIGLMIVFLSLRPAFLTSS